MISRKSLRRAYDKWIKGAEMRNGLERACDKMNKVEHTHKLRMAFYKYRAQAAAAKRAEYIESKCQSFAETRRKTQLKDFWITWTEYIRVFKLAQKFLNRANLGMDRGQRSRAFYKWRQLMVNEVH